MAERGVTNLNIFCSHGKKTYTTVSGALLSCQSFNHRGTQGNIQEVHYMPAQEQQFVHRVVSVELQVSRCVEYSIVLFRGQFLSLSHLLWLLSGERDPQLGKGRYFELVLRP